MYILDLALNEAYHDVAYETCANTDSDVVGEWHQDDGQERRDTDSIILPIDLFDLSHHQEADDDQSWSCCFVRDDRNEWSEESSQ